MTATEWVLVGVVISQILVLLWIIGIFKQVDYHSDALDMLLTEYADNKRKGNIND